MAVIKHHKYVSALPATLEADSIYYVRRGTGFDIYVTNSTGLVVAYPLNQAVDPWLCYAIGDPFGLWTHLAGVPTPPTDNPNYRYIKLTASDSYNTGVLTSESVSGSAPLVQATAVINSAGSPMNGQTVRLINTERRVIRAGSSGVVEADALQGHKHRLPSSYASADLAPYGTFSPTPQTFTHGDGTATAFGHLSSTASDSDGSNGAPRIAGETRVKSIGAEYYMRIR